MARARAMATRCCSPPETGRIVMLAVGKSDFDEERQLAAVRRARRQSPSGQARFPTQSAKRNEERRRSRCAGLETREGVFVESRDVHSVEDDASLDGESSRQEPGSVDFPLPDGPVIARTRPDGTVRSVGAGSSACRSARACRCREADR